MGMFYARQIPKLTTRQRLTFERRVIKTGSCWLWEGNHIHTGYAIMSLNSRNYPAHRVSYEIFVGKIPEGLTIDHLCRNRGCVNPAHLEAVSFRTNSLRGTAFVAVNAAKTHCVNGHEFTEANTYIRPKKSSGAITRNCRICMREERRRYRLKIESRGAA